MLLVHNRLTGFIFISRGMTRKFITGLFFLSFFLVAGAQDVLPELATTIGRNFLIEKAADTLQDIYKNAKVETVATHHDGSLVYYQVLFGAHGFVLVAGDQRTQPVLAYSLEPAEGMQEIPPAAAEWLNWYSQQILQVKDENLEADPAITAQWLHYSDEAACQSQKGKDAGVEPLSTSEWGQRHYYNSMCPADPDGPGGHAIAGCVATALAQVLFYYRYPLHGEGANGYMSDYGYEYVDFEEAEYRYDEMVNAVYGQYGSEVAELVYHAAVSVEMDFGPNSSGALTADAMDALRDHFGYRPDLNYISKFDQDIAFGDSIRHNLDQHRVVLYRGGDMGSGHAFVCDGYQDSTYLHFNWGWNGSFNGFYLIENLNPNVYNFTFNQEAIINIYPEDDYPAYCQETQTLAASRGTFTDGSGPESCLPATSCSWPIVPDQAGITNIQLWFTRFDTGSTSDIVSVYDGTSVNDPLLGQFSGNSLPPLLVSTGPALLVTFETGVTADGQGWAAEYLAYSDPFCNPLTQMNTMNQNWFTDASGPYNYIDNSDCSWWINPQDNTVDSVGQVHLYFHSMDLAEGDTIYIYEGADNTAMLQGKYTGTTLPDTIHSTGNQLLLNFVTNNAGVADGWAAGYKSSLPVYCEDTTLYTSKTAVIEDGSGDKRYVPDSDCYWLIETENTELITFEFLEFDLEYGYDQLRLYDASVTPPLQFAALWGHEIPDMLQCNSNRILLRFITDESAEYGGWKLKYTALAPGIRENDLAGNVQLMPNPAEGSVLLQGLTQDAGISLYNLNMRRIRSLAHHANSGQNCRIELAGLSAGMYYIGIEINGTIALKKLIVR